MCFNFDKDNLRVVCSIIQLAQRTVIQIWFNSMYMLLKGKWLNVTKTHRELIQSWWKIFPNFMKAQNMS